MTRRDAPGAVLVPEPVGVVGEAHTVELLKPVQVAIEAVGEDAEGDRVLLAPRDQAMGTWIRLDGAQEGVELLLGQRKTIEKRRLQHRKSAA